MLFSLPQNLTQSYHSNLKLPGFFGVLSDQVLASSFRPAEVEVACGGFAKVGCWKRSTTASYWLRATGLRAGAAFGFAKAANTCCRDNIKLLFQKIARLFGFQVHQFRMIEKVFLLESLLLSTVRLSKRNLLKV